MDTKYGNIITNLRTKLGRQKDAVQVTEDSITGFEQLELLPTPEAVADILNEAKNPGSPAPSLKAKK